MSFGFGVGDFLAVGNLAWTVYRSCKDLAKEFQEICREALTVHTVLKELQDKAIDPQSLLNSRGAPRKQELMLLVKNLEETLKELDEVVRKYQGLARRERNIWNQLRLAIEDLDKIRSKLTFHVIAINAFTSSLSRGTLAQIETALLELASEVRQGRRQPSLASLHETNVDSVWRELESELASDGIASTDVAKHKAAIKVFLQGLLSNANVDAISLVEVASLIESGNNDTDSESLSTGLFALDQSPGDSAELSTSAHAQSSSLASMDDEECESADDVLFPENAIASDLSTQTRFTRPGTASPTFDDALEYVDLVKAHQPDMYKQFLDILQSYDKELLDIPGMIDWVSALFVCHPEFIQRLNIFLPENYGIECGTVDNRYAFRVIMPFAAYVRIPDLEAMQSLSVVGKRLYIGQPRWVDPASLNILRPHPQIAAPLDWRTNQPVSRAPGVILARMKFPRRLKAFLARPKASKESATDIHRSEEMNGTTHVNELSGLTMTSTRAPQSLRSSQAQSRISFAVTRSSG